LAGNRANSIIFLCLCTPACIFRSRSSACNKASRRLSVPCRTRCRISAIAC